MCGLAHMRVFPIEKDTCSIVGLLGRVMRERTSDILADPLPQAMSLLMAALAGKERHAPDPEKNPAAGQDAKASTGKKDAPA
jgi:hypothetical protein